MDGILLVPPDARQILGRALWKPRWVVVGRRGASRDQQNPSYTQIMTTSRIHGSAPRQPKPSEDDYVISIYKAKNRHRSPDSPDHISSYPINPEDWELSSTHAVNSVSDCQVQMVAHRKQGPVLPTLVVTISDKDKKRRSSRAGGLIPTKDSGVTSLWFRNPPDDHHPSLHDWSRFIMSRKLPMSPDSPASPQFVNPFASRSREGPDYFNRPSSGNPNSRSGSGQKGYGPNGSRDRPVTFSSESPSLRSKRSDISSPSSLTYQGQIGAVMPAQHYTTVLPTDLPSPTGTVGEYSSEFIEGWTAAQGRTSALSSPGRTRDSMSSPAPSQVGVAVPMTPGMTSSSPPGPRETILDRAFQLRCIPGSDRGQIPGEEKLSSLARFDALMREADERRKRQEAAAEAEKKAMQSVWDNESSDEEEEEDDEDDDDEEEDADEYGMRESSTIPPHAQRALEFIAGRHGAKSPRPVEPTSPPGFDADSLRTLTMHSQAPLTGPNRPRTAHARIRPAASQRAYSQPQLAAQLASVNHSLEVPTPSTRTSEESGSRGLAPLEKRQSNSSTKRYSLNEFTKRLSSTSSLLLVQTNTSNASSRGSSEMEAQSQVPRATMLNPRGAPPIKDREREEWEKRCGWRGSVGVFGEGNFL